MHLLNQPATELRRHSSKHGGDKLAWGGTFFLFFAAIVP